MNTSFLLLGSNQGNRLHYLNSALTLLGELNLTILKRSKVYETAAWGIEDLPPHLNQAIKISTTMSAIELLHAIQHIEKMLGRKRVNKWGMRTIDIDILFYNQDIINTKQLTIPHPLLQNRRFALIPLSEIAPNDIHPVFKVSVMDLLENCQDHLPVRLYHTLNF